ncbi:MAG: ABC transporter ATP-binding protein [Chloroflexota bacterium]
MLQVNNIEVTYHDVMLVVRGISLEVPEGAIIALLGANGAGKSTTLKAISGLLKTEVGKVSEGSIFFDSQRLDKLDPETIAKLGIIQVLEGGQVLEHLTVEENLKLGGFIRHDGNLKGDLEKVYNYFPGLREIRNNTSGFISGGERQMLVIGRALMAHPKFMMLDEPSLGLAPLLVKEIFEIVQRINQEEHTSILLVEQNVRAALSIAQYGYIMESGRIVLDGPAEKLRNNEDVQEFYLGFSKLGQRKSYRDVKHYKRRRRWL